MCGTVALTMREIKGYDIQSDTLTFTSAGGGLGTMRLYKITQATMANRVQFIQNTKTKSPSTTQKIVWQINRLPVREEEWLKSK
ncbi:hypothetical protein Q1695_004188 [Nippostrongylus brasiliensis]|nr:hypothetical protein Q1695_004188 [Nippostrongylus brasiliensis]